MSIDKIDQTGKKPREVIVKQFRMLWCVVAAVVLTGEASSATIKGTISFPYIFQNDGRPLVDDLAIVALHEECGGTEVALTWSGSNSTIDGAVHSNGDLKISGSSNTVTGAVTSGCAADVSGQSNALGTGATQAETIPSPMDIQAADFICDFEPPEGNLDQSGPWWEGGTSQSGRLLAGVYCAEGRIKLATSGVTGVVTFIATGSNAELALSGSSFDLRPYDGNMLAYSEGSTGDALKISGSGGTWQGVLYSPNGEVSLSGSGGQSPAGMIIGDTVTISGSGWAMTGLPAPLPPPTEVTNSTGAILVHVYACPIGQDEDQTEFDWFEVCAPASERLTFELSPVGADDPQRGTTNVNGQVIFTQLSPGIYELTTVDAGWCHAKSDRVNARGEIVVQADEHANVWTFYCTAGKE
jgi:hypothetical protein